MHIIRDTTRIGSHLASLAVISIAATIATSVAYGKTPQENFEQNRQSVVAIRTDNADAIGRSGVVISSDLVATGCNSRDEYAKAGSQLIVLIGTPEELWVQTWAETVVSDPERNVRWPRYKDNSRRKQFERISCACEG